VPRSANRKLSIYCDGSSHGRSGWPGGWAFVVVEGVQVLLSENGAHRSTTNNIMELQAALAGLNAILARRWHTDAEVELVSDSQFTLRIASGVYLPGKNRDLALAVRKACVEVVAQVRWVEGHSGDVWNERVDALAHEAKQTLVPARVKKRAERKKPG
jgi:ribonuclease HI